MEMISVTAKVILEEKQKINGDVVELMYGSKKEKQFEIMRGMQIIFLTMNENAYSALTVIHFPNSSDCFLITS